MLAAALAGGGCDLFRPADPEPPGGSVIIPDYSSPETTLESLALALADKARTNGTSVYVGAFAESTSAATPAYHHFFSPEDAASWIVLGREVPVWNLNLEQNFYIKFVTLRGEDYRLIWIPDDLNPDDIRETQATIHRYYTIDTEDLDGNLTGALARGFADLTFLRGTDGNWRITRWEDRVDPSADPGAEEVTLGRRRLNT